MDRPVHGAAGWTSRSIGSGFQHRIFYAMIRLGGQRAAYALLHPVVAYYTLCRPGVRRRTVPYLRRRFPGPGPVRLRDSFRMSLNLGKVLVDRAVVGILGPQRMDVVLRGREELLALVGEGKGLVIVTAHVGCWQVAMSCLGFLQIPVSMLMQQAEDDVDRHYFDHGGGGCPYRIIDPTGYLGGALEMVEVLRRGEVLCVMGDRVLGSDRSAVAVPFLGAEAALPYGAFKVAGATGAPVAVLLSAKTGFASYDLELSRVIRVPGGLGRSAGAYRPYAAEFARTLERYVEAHPYQFFNFFDMWQRREPRPGSERA